MWRNKSWTGQNSIFSTKPSTRTCHIFCVFGLSLQELVLLSELLPLTVPGPLGWTGTCHRVKKHMKKTQECSIFPVIKIISCSFDTKKEWMSVLPPLLVPFIFHSAEGKKREHGAREEKMLERKVEVELRHIQQQMQYYYSRKQELR